MRRTLSGERGLGVFVPKKWNRNKKRLLNLSNCVMIIQRHEKNVEIFTLSLLKKRQWFCEKKKGAIIWAEKLPLLEQVM